jgi:hypothetical protein
MLRMKKAFCMFLIFTIASPLFAAKTRKPANYKVANALADAVTQIGDECATDKNIFESEGSAEQVFNIILWVKRANSTEMSDMGATLSCIAENKPEVFKEKMGKLTPKLQGELKAIMEKSKKTDKDNS